MSVKAISRTFVNFYMSIEGETLQEKVSHVAKGALYLAAYGGVGHALYKILPHQMTIWTYHPTLWTLPPYLFVSLHSCRVSNVGRMIACFYSQDDCRKAVQSFLSASSRGEKFVAFCRAYYTIRIICHEVRTILALHFPRAKNTSVSLPKPNESKSLSKIERVCEALFNTALTAGVVVLQLKFNSDYYTRLGLAGGFAIGAWYKASIFGAFHRELKNFRYKFGTESLVDLEKIFKSLDRVSGFQKGAFYTSRTTSQRCRQLWASWDRLASAVAGDPIAPFFQGQIIASYYNDLITLYQESRDKSLSGWDPRKTEWDQY